MIKKVFYNSIKVLVLLFVISCTQDELLDTPEETVSQEISDFTINRLDTSTFTEYLSQNKSGNLSEIFNPKTNSSNNRSAQNNSMIFFEEFDFWVDIDNVLNISQGTKQHFTFSVQSVIMPEAIQNLSLTINEDGSYSTTLIHYDLTENDIEKVNLGESVNLVNKLNAELIDIDPSHLTRGQIIDNGDGTCNEIIQTTGPLGFPVEQIIAGVPCESSGGGGSGGGGSISGNTIPGDNTGYNGSEGDTDTDSSLGGGGSSSGGGNTSNSNDDPDCIADIFGNCIGTITTIILPTSGESLPVSILTDNINQYAEPDLTYQEVFENREFAEAALDALEDGAEVDFENKIILDPSFIGTQIDCVLNSLTQNDNNIWRRVSEAFTPNDSEYRIRFTTYNNPNDTANARTGLPGNDNIINIRFNLANTSSGSLEIAMDILHETFHAELHRIHLTGNAPPNSLPQVQFDRFEQLWVFYSQSNNTDNGTAADSEHFFIGQYLIDPIASGMREFDSNSQSIDSYKFPIWDGLPSSVKSYYNIGDDEIENLSAEYSNVLNDDNEPPCN